LRAPYFLRSRQKGVELPFAGWDYGLRKEGAFVPVPSFDAAPEDLPLVSVVVRTHGERQALLRQALTSIAHQTYPNIEVVVAEDGGAGAAELCGEIQSMTGLAVRHLPLEKVGRCHAGNAGLQECCGELIGFLDDDDLFFADHVELLVSALLRNPELSAAYALAWESEVRCDAEGIQKEVMHRTVPAHRQPFSHVVLAIHNLMPIQAVLFRRALYEELGGFDPELEILEDWDLWRRYSHGREFELVEKTTSIYHVPADLSTSAERQLQLDHYYQLAQSRFEQFKASRAAAGD
jgi:glycosyltransferase involved in cell wall biosynthesis